METPSPPTKKTDTESCRACTPCRLESKQRLKVLRSSGLLEGVHESLDRISLLTQDLLEAPVVLVSLVEIDRQVFASKQGLPDPWDSKGQTPLSHSFCQHVVTDGKPLIVTDARQDPRLKTNLAITDLNVVAYAGYPIVAAGQVLGSFCAIQDKPHHWTPLELRVLREFSEAISDQIEVRFDLQQLKEAKERLARVNSDLENMASILSHDLKSPLRGIMGCLQVLQLDRENFDSDQREVVNHVHMSAARMAELIDALNSYSRATTPSADAVHLSLDSLVADVTADIKADLESQSAELLVDGELGTVTGYPPLLRQLFQNLISNALKFQPGGQAPRVEVGRTPDDGFYVKDNGIGMEPKYQDRSFLLYDRAGVGDEFEGSGIGLAICSRVVAYHGGRIWVESEPGRGSTFFFTLTEGFRA